MAVQDKLNLPYSRLFASRCLVCILALCAEWAPSLSRLLADAQTISQSFHQFLSKKTSQTSKILLPTRHDHHLKSQSYTKTKTASQKEAPAASQFRGS